MIRFLDLAAQYRSLLPDIDDAIRRVLDSAVFIGGPAVSEFERSFGAFCGGVECVGVGNGTDALELSLASLDLPPGSEVLVPANSFVASSEAVTTSGHTVRFVDPDPSSLLLSAVGLRSRMTQRTAAVVVVHLYGQAADMAAIMQVARENNLKVVEDCAQAHGAKHNGQHVGTFGDFGTFSFYPGKNLGAYGDGGAVVSRDPGLAKRVRMLANHGRVAKYDHEFEGRCSRLDAIQAAVLSVKLKALPSWIDARNRVASIYRSRLTGIGDLVMPALVGGSTHAYHLFVVQTERRNELAAFLREHGIETGVHYPVALPALKAYSHLAQADACPVSVGASTRLLSLPIGEHLTEFDVETVCAKVVEFFSH